ncbi:PREDICTED: wall-associated receptor kinase-like 10 [Prunus mume]|uniref:Wall-associated receptor kinase-like 10 n=1 Tax=Prunus mume TaxID=102107 RepID=A0ABM1LNJ4_PRUMU|nr:PREDICTED: wall-associated receptor kinase-like 10 [Prunus mume]
MDVVLFLSHITLSLWCMSSAMLAAPSEAVPLLAKPNCQSRCGDVEIPYPFGNGEGCYIDDWFQIKCVNSTKPFLNIINLEVLEISVKGTLNVANPITISSNYNANKPILQAANLEGSPFVFSQENIFTAMGCGVMATITSDSNGYTISAGLDDEDDDWFG